MQHATRGLRRFMPLRRWRLRSALVSGGVVALVLLLLWWGNAFSQARLGLGDLFFTPFSTTDTIVLVAIDDESLAEYGRSPLEWDRALFADLIGILNAAAARVIAFDVIFVETSNPESDARLAEAIQNARASDNRTRFVMPLAGTQLGSTSENQALRYQETITPLPLFAEQVDYLGYVNTFSDVDGVVRRQATIVHSGTEANEQTFLSFTLTSYLAYLRIPAAAIEQVVQSQPGQVTLADGRELSVDRNGMWRQNFFRNPEDWRQSPFPIVSFRDVLAGNVDPALFEDKLVMVGLMNNVGATDIYYAPIARAGEQIPGVEIQAHAIETLAQNLPLREQSRLSQALMIIGLTLFSSIIYAEARWFWDFPLAILLIVLWTSFAFINFTTRLEVTNLLYALLALTVPLVTQLGVNFATELSRRQQAEFLLESVVAVSHQRLELDRILPRIAEDVQRIMSAPTGAVWLWNRDADDFVLAHSWSLDDEMKLRTHGFAHQTHERNRPIVEHGLVALPLTWQNRFLGALVTHSSNRRQPPLRMLQNLADQIAPSIENALLYTETQQQKRLLEAIQTGSPTGILLIDPDYTIRTFNPAAEAVLSPKDKHDMQVALDKRLAELGSSEKEQTALLSGFKNARRFQLQVELGEQTFSIHAAPLPSGEWVVILNDVTALAELNKIRTHMIRMASHDLNNPLSRVLAYGTLILEDGSDSPMSHKFVQYMVNAGEEMRDIIQDVLNLEKSRSGSGERRPLVLAELVRQVAERHRQSADLKQQSIAIDLSDETTEIIGNEQQLSQALANLIGNAVKYTPEQGQVTVRLAKRDGRLRFEVEDTGYGIPEEAQKNLFTEFYRVRSRSTEHISGTGLGLSLVKAVIEAHGGQVGVQSEEGVGSIFHFEIPYVAEGVHAN